MLLSKGVRLTPQRIVVARIALSMIDNHPSFLEIYEEARKVIPNISISTTYSIIKMLESLGIISLIEIDGKTHIDRPHRHVNIVCSDTNSIIDLDPEISDRIIESITKEIGDKSLKSILLILSSCGRDNTD